MNAPAGWYPDPGGQAGMFRYWDGQSWSAQVTANPHAAPPAPGAVPPPNSGTRSRWWVWALTGLVALVVVGLVVVFVTKPAIDLPGLGRVPGAEPSADPCRSSLVPSAKPVIKGDGRVHGGPLSYPMLPAPWTSPRIEDRVPFAVNAMNQAVIVEEGYDGNHSWVAALTVGNLVAGDGFFAPKEGAEVVANCVVGLFYGNNKIDRQDVSSQAITVDGHKAWQLTMHLTFDIPKLKCKGETAIIVIVETGKMTSGLLYASIPDTTPQLMPVALNTINQLKVDA